MIAKLNAFLSADGRRLVCASIRVDEMPTNTVTFEGDPASVLPRSPQLRPWWTRADMSVNDLAPDTCASAALLGLAAE